MKHSTLLLLAVLLWSCQKKDDTPPPANAGMYFPPSQSTEWERVEPASLGWDASAIPDLLSYLDSNNTRGFILLKDGKIAVEAYFGNNILNTAPFDQNAIWYWASAGKALTATLVGIAQQEGDLNINQPTSDYLGQEWTSLSTAQEQQITVKNQLSMTTGLDYTTSDLDCTQPSCLSYRKDPGQQWFYHNAPYTLLEKVVENATGINYNSYTDQKIESIIGMSGQWYSSGYNNVYWSSARDMARFGLLILNRGQWAETKVLEDAAYYSAMTTPSQNLNPSYGYLWWLNGQSSIIYPGLPNSFNTSLAPNAPTDLFAGMGKNGQFVEVVPSQNLVLIRLGEAPDGSLVPIAFHNEMWGRVRKVVRF